MLNNFARNKMNAMKRIIPILILMLFAGCFVGNYDALWIKSINSSIAKRRAEKEHLKEMEEKWKDYPFPGANMNYLIMRSDDQNPPDTIVDGIGYAHV